MARRRTALSVFLLCGLAASGLGAAGAMASTTTARPAAALDPTMNGLYVPVTPTRIMDTRTGLSGHGQLGPAQTASLKVTGTPVGLPVVPEVGVKAVVVNVTVVRPTSSGHLSVYQGPVIAGPPPTSSMNFLPGWTGANLVTVGVGSQGRIAIYNSSGHTHVLVDVVGWYANTAATVVPASVYGGNLNTRLWDTRQHTPLASGAQLTQPVDVSGTPWTDANNHVKALVVTLTAVNPQASGHLTAWSGVGRAPTTSVLNYQPGSIVANLAVIPAVPCSSCTGPDLGRPSFAILNGSAGRADVVIDLVGYYLDYTGPIGRFELSPQRLVDTRRHGANFGSLGDAASRSYPLPVEFDGYELDFPQRVLNVTSLPRANTFVTVWGFPSVRPATSTFSPRAGVPVAVSTYIDASDALGSRRMSIQVYNANGPNDLVIDQAGWFYLPFLEAKAPQGRPSVTVVPGQAVIS